MELLSPEYAVYSPSGYPEPTSRELLIKSYQGAREAFSELTWSIEDLVAAQDKVISRIIAKGTYKGGVPGLPKDEIKFEFSMITIMRIDDGKIVEEWQEDDQLGLVRQLGMELKPKEIEK
jgi:predicted ester cyclase